MMMVGVANLKYVIFTIAFFVAGSFQENASSKNLSDAANHDALRNEFNDDSSVKVVAIRNSSVILDSKNATNNSTQPPQSEQEDDASSNLELLHILKERLTFYFAEKQSFLSSVLIILLAAVSIVSYLMLVSWRRHLQKIYGNRECLVQNEVLNEKNSPYIL